MNDNGDSDDLPAKGGTLLGPAAMVTDAPPPSPTRVSTVLGLPAGSQVFSGRFRVLRKVGAGGMGEVFQAEQVALARHVALKLLRTEWGLDANARERFAREATVLASVDHPSVVRVVDYGEVEGRPCLVMEWVSGELLEQTLRPGPLLPSRAVSLLVQLAGALEAVHERNIVHRDIKPENVMVQDGDKARLLDFGIARLVEADGASNLTQVGLVVGTPEYLSPEQALGLPATTQSDLYSLGVLAYRMLTGVLPFEGPSPRGFLTQHIGQKPIPLELRAPSLATQPALCELVNQLLEKEPARRPASASEVCERLLASQARSIPSSAAAAIVAPARTFSGASFPALTVQRPAARGARPKNLALMLTDIKGFTERTSRQTREENAWMLAEHDRLLIPIVRYYRGRLVQKRGDALLVTFTSPTEAVQCGMAMQDRLYQYNSMLPPQTRLHVRVCVHAGEVLEAGRELFGEPVQVLAAVEHVAEAGAVTFTAAVSLAMNRVEVAAEPCGDLQTPGRAERLSLYRATASPQGLPFAGRFLPTETATTGLTLATRALVTSAGVSVTRALAFAESTARTTATRAVAAYQTAAATERGQSVARALSNGAAAAKDAWSRIFGWVRSRLRGG